MGKVNPKHNQKYKKYYSSAEKSLPSPTWNPIIPLDSNQLPLPPVPLSQHKKQLIIRKYEAVLFKIESLILLYHKETFLSGLDVARVLALLLWNRACSQYGKKDQLPVISEQLRLDPNSKKLYFQLKHKLLTYVREYLSRQKSKTIKNGTRKSLGSSVAITWDCFAVVYDSCRFWIQKNGTEGYLKYISDFVDPEDWGYDETLLSDLEEDLEEAFQNVDK